MNENKIRLIKEISNFGKDDFLKFIISKAKKLDKYPLDKKTDEFLIKGCLSKVWLYVNLENGVLRFFGDSESIVTKGLISLLIELYSGLRPSEIIDSDPKDIFQKIKINEFVSMNRKNGIANMIKQIYIYANVLK